MWENLSLSIENFIVSRPFKWAQTLAANISLCLCNFSNYQPVKLPPGKNLNLHLYLLISTILHSTQNHISRKMPRNTLNRPRSAATSLYALTSPLTLFCYWQILRGTIICFSNNFWYYYFFFYVENLLITHCTLQEHQRIRTNATVSKDSEIVKIPK